MLLWLFWKFYKIAELRFALVRVWEYYDYKTWVSNLMYCSNEVYYVEALLAKDLLIIFFSRWPAFS